MEPEKQALNKNGAATGDAATKPAVMRVQLPCGKIRLYNVSEAARWLGCSRQCLSQMAHGTHKYVSQELLDRAKSEFPKLFAS